MKRYIGVLIPTVGFIVSAGIVAWLLHEHLPGYRLVYLLIDADIVLKLAMVHIALLSLGVLVLGLAALKRSDASHSRLLLFTAIASAALGVLAAAYGVHGARYMLGTVITFAHRAPFYAESAFVAALGFLVATMAMTFRAMGDRRG